MANEWNETDIQFHDFCRQEIQHAGQTNALEYGKTHDELPSRVENGVKVTDTKHKSDVKDHLPPWVEQPTDIDKTLTWEMKREKKLLDLRQHPTYQFVMLVAGFSDEPMEKFYNNVSEDSHEHTRASQRAGEISQSNCSSIAGADCDGQKHSNMTKNIRLHNWYIDTPWADGLIFLSGSMFAHIEESYVAITSTCPQLKHYKLSMFTETEHRTMFAKLVANLIRTSSVLAGKRYSLDATYRRLNLEKRRIMNYFYAVKGKREEESWESVIDSDPLGALLTDTDISTMLQLQEQMT